MNTFESAVKLLQDNPNSVELSRHFEVFVEGLTDLQNRLQVNELNNIRHSAQLSALEARMADANSILGSLGNDRTNLKSRVDTIEATPRNHGDRITAAETRIRTIEGAIGAMGGKIAPPLVDVSA
jgi:chromosome segregation ATPase